MCEPGDVLRSLELTDAGWIYEACQDAEIQRWTLVPRPYLREHAESFVRDGAGEFRNWVIDLGGERPVGMIGVHTVENGVASFGYWVAPWGRGRGAASGAVRAVIDELRALGGVVALTANIAQANVPSRRTVETCGFTVSRALPLASRDNGLAVDAVEYRLDLG
ncbi:MAG: hypothetical protein RL547_549 [Actinomycetota bacterium]